MELLQLTDFCDAALTENFSKTAEKYKVPPSNISQSIKRLEKELSIALFDRRANRVVLYPVGDYSREVYLYRRTGGHACLEVFCRVLRQEIQAEQP